MRDQDEEIQRRFLQQHRVEGGRSKGEWKTDDGRNWLGFAVKKFERRRKENLLLEEARLLNPSHIPPATGKTSKRPPQPQPSSSSWIWSGAAEMEGHSGTHCSILLMM